MAEFLLCTHVRALMQPAAQQMVCNCKWMRPARPSGCCRLSIKVASAGRTTRVFQLRAVDNDILADGPRGAPNHQG